MTAERVKFVWRPKEWDAQVGGPPPRIGYVPPVVGLHANNPLVPAKLVLANDPNAKHVFTAGEAFEAADPYMTEFCKALPAFRRV
jgi:hypothetical protein